MYTQKVLSSTTRYVQELVRLAEEPGVLELSSQLHPTRQRVYLREAVVRLYFLTRPPLVGTWFCVCTDTCTEFTHTYTHTQVCTHAYTRAH